jgi:hypothetical protein
VDRGVTCDAAARPLAVRRTKPLSSARRSMNPARSASRIACSRPPQAAHFSGNECRGVMSLPRVLSLSRADSLGRQKEKPTLATISRWALERLSSEEDLRRGMPNLRDAPQQ